MDPFFENGDVVQNVLSYCNHASVISCLQACKLFYRYVNTFIFPSLDLLTYPRAIPFKAKHLKIWNFQIDQVSEQAAALVTHLEVRVWDRIVMLSSTNYFKNIRELTIIAETLLNAEVMWHIFQECCGNPQHVVLQIVKPKPLTGLVWQDAKLRERLCKMPPISDSCIRQSAPEKDGLKSLVLNVKINMGTARSPYANCNVTHLLDV